MVKKTEITKIMISDVNFSDALEEVKKWLKNGLKKHYIVTPNPEILVVAQKNKTLSQILNQADLALPDGIGILWASRILGKSLKGKVAGADFMDGLCKMAEKEGFTVGLIGGKSQVAVKAAECLQKSYPKLKIVLAQEEWGESAEVARPRFFRLPILSRRNTHIDAELLVARKGSTQKSGGLPAPKQDNLTIQQSNNETIDILFVAFGAPKQEIWIKDNLNNLPVKVAMGVGGAFDYLAGRVPRAPKWVQNLGLEWLFRLIRQPWRIKRQMALLRFIALVLKEKYSLRPIDLRS